VTKKRDAEQKQAIRKKQDKDIERKLRNAQKCSECRGKSTRCNFQPGAKRCENCIMRRRGCRPSTDEDDEVYELHKRSKRVKYQALRDGHRLTGGTSSPRPSMPARGITSLRPLIPRPEPVANDAPNVRSSRAQ
jgi:hypothetical protein